MAITVVPRRRLKFAEVFKATDKKLINKQGEAVLWALFKCSFDLFVYEETIPDEKESLGNRIKIYVALF
jgi:hypothetical protein